MEPPPLLADAHHYYTNSSPSHSRPIHPLPEKLPSTLNSSIGAGKLRLMCSYNGHIIPIPHDKSLRYVGGETRIIVVDRNSSLSFLTTRLSKTLITNGESFTLKYQLPNEEIDSLISLTTNEDLENMIHEYDTISAAHKSYRLRLFLFTSKKPVSGSTKTEDWFLNDDERSEQGTQNPSQIQTHSPSPSPPPNPTGGIELLSSEVYQDSTFMNNNMIPIDQTLLTSNFNTQTSTVNDYGYQKLNNQHHQFIQNGSNYINQSRPYYSIYPPHPLPQHQIIYVTSRQTPSYLQPTASYGDSSSSIGIANLTKPEMFMGSTELGLQPSIQVYSGQPQYSHGPLTFPNYANHGYEYGQ